MIPNSTPRWRSFAALRHRDAADRPAMPRTRAKSSPASIWSENALKGRSFEVWRRKIFSSRMGKRRGGHAHSWHHAAAGRQGVQRCGTRPVVAVAGGLFPVFEEAPRTVHRDGYVELKRAYYSVPPEYVAGKSGCAGSPGCCGDQPAPGSHRGSRAGRTGQVHHRSDASAFALPPGGPREPGTSAGSGAIDWRPYGSWPKRCPAARSIGTRVLHGLLALAQKHPVKAWSRQRKPPCIMAPGDCGTCGRCWNTPPLAATGLSGNASANPQLDTYRDCVPDCFATATSTINKHEHPPNHPETTCLSGLSQTLDVRLQEAAANRLSHAEFLELICQDELNVRQQRLMERHTKLADFRHLKTLDDFDWSFNPSVHKKRFSIWPLPVYSRSQGCVVPRPPASAKPSGPGHRLRSHPPELPGALPLHLRSGA